MEAAELQDMNEECKHGMERQECDMEYARGLEYDTLLFS